MMKIQTAKDVSNFLLGVWLCLMVAWFGMTLYSLSDGLRLEMRVEILKDAMAITSVAVVVSLINLGVVISLWFDKRI